MNTVDKRLRQIFSCDHSALVALIFNAEQTLASVVAALSAANNGKGFLLDASQAGKLEALLIHIRENTGAA